MKTECKTLYLHNITITTISQQQRINFPQNILHRMRNIELELPAYLTLSQYKSLDKVYSLEDRLQTLYSISAISGIDFETIKKWDLATISAEIGRAHV